MTIMPDDDGLGLLDAYEEQKEERGTERFINKRRATTLVDREFAGTGLRDDVGVGMQGTDPTVETTSSLPDDEFDTFRDTVGDFTTFVGGPGPDFNEVDESALDDVPDPRTVHEQRSEVAQRQDERLSAPLTNDPQKYARHPGEYDWPGVDSPAGSEASDASTLDELESLFR